MFWDYVTVFFISMVPLVELRVAMPYATEVLGLPFWESLAVCVIGNMVPVPFIYFFARKVLLWGADKKFIGRFFRFCLRKGERAGEKLVKTAGRNGLFVAMLLFVGIPIPGTGAWTGTLAASFLDMGFRTTTAAVSLGVVMAGIIMAVTSSGVLAVLGF